VIPRIRTRNGWATIENRSVGLRVARRGIRLAEQAFDALLPQVCVSCSAAMESGRAPLCGSCETRLPEIPAPRCPRCGFTRLPDLSAPGSCAECADWPEALLRAESAFLLSPIAKRLVHGLKYGGWTSLGARMGALMAPAARRVCPSPALLVPVPLTPSRLRERGYNQSLLLAEGLGRELGWSVGPILIRTRAGRRQARSDRRERAHNVAGVFRLASRSDPSGPTVLLVDDVITTGATLAACCQAVIAAGIPCAGAVSFARTPPRSPVA
jgi:ComF family protein